MRVVALTCSNTEIVAALGCGDLLVGVDDHSDFPTELVAKLPRLGPDLGIDLEKVKALRPDLVLASLTVPGHEKIVAGLEKASLPFLAPEPTRLQDVFADIRAIAQALEVPERGAALVARLAAELEPSPSPAQRPKIAVQWWPKPVILPGRKSWVSDLIAAAGGVSLIGDEDVKSRPLEDAEFATKAPDVIVMSWCGVEEKKYRADVIYRNPAFREIPAVRNKSVVAISEAFLGRPGPRLVEGLRALRAVVGEGASRSSE